MRIHSKLAGTLLGLCLLPLAGLAQSYWRVAYQGTATSRDDSNKLRTETVTENSFIQHCATNAGVTDLSNLALVLHFDANEVGDALEVINTSDPNLFRCEVFKFAFPESYTNSAGTVMKRFAYLYNSESDHSRGSVIIDRRVSVTRRGVTNAPTLDGKMQFWLGTWDANTNDPSPTVCSGTLTGKEPLTLP
ncbi:MAG: hypothetical protein ACTHLW_20095 [Verrucomicrobiota bacterium]